MHCSITVVGVCVREEVGEAEGDCGRFILSFTLSHTHTRTHTHTHTLSFPHTHIHPLSFPLTHSQALIYSLLSLLLSPFRPFQPL